MQTQSSTLSDEQRRLLDRLLAAEGIGEDEGRVTPRTGGSDRAPLSFGQERLFVVDRLQPGSPMYVGSGALRIRGPLDVERLRRAVTLLVDRHEVLRTGIVETDLPDVPAEQVIHRPGTVEVQFPVGSTTAAGVEEELRREAGRGFALDRPPLLRTCLLRVTDAPGQEWVLILTVHHIAVDGWSLGLLTSELGALYTELEQADGPGGQAGGPDGQAAGADRGRGPVTGSPELQYADFAVWQREQLTGDVLAGQVTHWREKLASLAATEVPTDRPRPAERTYAGDTVPLAVPAEVTAALRTLTDETRSTLFMALAAAWAAVLGRWSGHDDVVVGTPVAGRRRAELESVVGFFVNTLPLRIPLGGTDGAAGEAGGEANGESGPEGADVSFRSLLLRTREVCNEAYAHQDVPFERIVAETQSSRDASGQTAVARHWLALHNTPPLGPTLGGLECEPLPARVDTVRCDLSVQLHHGRDGGLTGRLEYSTELFDRPTAEALAGALVTLVTAAARQPELPVRALPVLSEDAHEHVLHRLSGVQVPPLTGPSVPEAFAALAESDPTAVAVVDEASGAVTTYGELAAAAAEVTRFLAERSVGAEDRVGVLLPRGPQLAAAFLGVLAAGATVMPLDPHYPPARLAQLTEDGAPALVLTVPALSPLVSRVAVADVTEVLAQTPDSGTATTAGPRAATAPDPAQGAYLLFTSGTTGRPKGVVNTHGGLVNRLSGMAADFATGPGDRVLQKAPLGFDVAIWELLLPLVTGATVVACRDEGHRDVDHLREVIDRHGVTICHFVPSMLEVFAEEPRTPAGDTPAVRHPSLKWLLSGGEELGAPLARRIRERFPHACLVNQYGPAEAVIDVTSGAVADPVPDRVPLGRPVPGAEVYVLDSALRPLPVGVAGDLHLGGVQLARGYVGRPGATAARFLPHPFAAGQRLYATGDRARLRPDGSLEFLGRADDQVKIGGNRVEPAEVAAVLGTHPAVSRSLVTVHRDATGAHKLLGYVSVTAPGEEEKPGAEAQPGEEQLTAVLRTFLRERLPEVMVPSQLFVLTEWPTGAHGKVDTAALPRPEEQAEPDSGHRAPTTPVQLRLAALCTELLGVERIGLDDSFFELGGHSLLAIRAVSRIRKEFGVGIPIGRFLKKPTLAHLATVVEQGLADAGDKPAGSAVAASRIPRIDRGALRDRPAAEETSRSELA